MSARLLARLVAAVANMGLGALAIWFLYGGVQNDDTQKAITGAAILVASAIADLRLAVEVRLRADGGAP